MIAQEAKTITKPTKAAVKVCCALAVFSLSPPAVIQRTPPIIRKIKATKAEMTKIKRIAAETILGMVSSPNLENSFP